MSIIGAHIRATWVPAKINKRLAEYHADLQAAIHAPMTGDTRLFFLNAATRLAAEDLERLENFGRRLGSDDS